MLVWLPIVDIFAECEECISHSCSDLSMMKTSLWWKKLCLIVCYSLFPQLTFASSISDQPIDKNGLTGTLIVVNKLGNDVSLIDVAN